MLLTSAPALLQHSVTNKVAILSAAAMSEVPRPPATRQGKH